MTYNILLIQLNIILAAKRERGKRTNPIPPKILATLCCIQARRLAAVGGGWWRSWRKVAAAGSWRLARLLWNP